MKINYSNFLDSDLVSALKKGFFLDPSQFEGLPNGDVELESVKVSRLDNDNSSEALSNVNRYEFRGKNLKAIADIAKLQIDDSMKKQLIASVQPVIFRVLIGGGEADNADELYNFITTKILSETESVKGKILKGLTYHVALVWSNQFKDHLGLVVNSFNGVKVVDGKVKA